MTLTLRITSYRGAAPAGSPSVSFEAQGGTLGRAPDNDWVLPDPERFVSSRHAAIGYRDGRYYVTDLSLNGLLVNGHKLGQGNSTVLSDGDVLGVGEYEVRCSLTAQAAPAGSPTEPEPRAFLPEGALGLEPVLPESGHPAGRTAPRLPDDLIGPLGREPLTETYQGIPGEQPPQPTGPPMRDDAARIHEPFLAPQATPEIPEQWWAEPASAAPTATPAAPAAPATPAAPAAPPPAAAGAGEAEVPLAAFLQGAGLPPSAVAGLSPPQVLELAGQLLRHVVGGLRELLAARSSIKQEARLEMTTLRATENNPLKFTVSTEEALRHLLRRDPEPGFLAPLQAIDEVMQDLKAHQLATLAGLEATLKGMFQRFDPARLERELTDRSLVGTLLPGHRKARYWDLFAADFRRIAQEAEEDVQALFGREFARAYEEQVRRLRLGNASHTDPSHGGSP
jgi:type VI secretion system protein